jgi:hypothetical protein
MHERKTQAFLRVFFVAVPGERSAKNEMCLGQGLRNLKRIERVFGCGLETAERELHARETDVRRGVARIPRLRLFEVVSRIGESPTRTEHTTKCKRKFWPRTHRALDRIELRARSTVIARKRQRTCP